MRAVLYDRKAEHCMRFATDVPIPTPGKGQVLVKVHSAGINPVDYKLPKIPVVGRFMCGKGVGMDFSGVVERVGQGVEGFAPGDRVFGDCKGSLAEYALADAAAVAPLPSSVSHPEAASLPIVALTTVQSLIENGFKPGDRVLVAGASGGTGTVGVQIAKCLGASHVTGICSAANADLVRSLGADKVVDYTRGDEEMEKELRESGPYDFCYDTVTSPDAVDKNYEPLSRRVLKPGGMHVAINGGVMDWTRALLSKVTRLNWQRRQYSLVLKRDDASQLKQVAQWVEEKKLKPLLDTQYSFSEEQVKAAFEKLESRRTKGKLVVNMV